MQNSPYRNLWLVLPPAIPILGALIILEFINVPNMALSSYIEAISTHDKTLFIENGLELLFHMGGMLIYSIVTYFHFFICLVSIIYCWVRIREARPFPKKPVISAVCLMILLVIGILIGLSGLNLAAYELTYFNFLTLLCHSPELNDLCEPYLWGVSKLALLVCGPAFLGIVAVLSASGVAVVTVRDIPEDDETIWRQLFSQRVHNLQECFYILSAVLVTSTLSAAIFFHLPIELIERENAAREALGVYTKGLSIFWGGIYTLTLMAIFLAPALLLWYRARVYAHKFHAVDSSKQFRDWLSSQELDITTNRHIGNFTALLAPLMVSMVSSASQFASVG